MKLFDYIKSSTLSTFAIASAIAMVSCADKEVSEPEINTDTTIETSQTIVFSFNVTTENNTGTRSTSTDYWDDVENNSVIDKKDPEEWESNVSSMAVILADPTTNKVLLTLPMEIDPDSGTSGNVTRGEKEIEVTDDALQNFFKNADANGDIPVNLFVVCNYYSESILPTTGESVQKTLTIENLADMSKYGGYNKDFLMTNADYFNKAEDEAKTKYQKTINIKELVKHTKKSGRGPYHLNVLDSDEEPISIPVQRALARIDLNINETVYYFSRDGEFLGDSKTKPNGTGLNWRTSIKIEYVGLMNINKKFNLFKEAGVPGTSSKGNNWGYFWAEMPNADMAADPTLGTQSVKARYVLDPEYYNKKSLINNTNGYGTYFSSYFFDPSSFSDNSFVGYDGADDIFDLYDVNGGKWLGEEYEDDDNGKEYHIWRYITPNTIHEAANQKVSISTGIIFVCRLNFSSGLEEGTLLEPGSDEKDATYAETPIYFWAGTPIGTNRKLQETVKNPKDSRERAIADAFYQAMGDNFFEPADETKTFDEWIEAGKPWTNFLNISDWNDSKDNRYLVYNTVPNNLQAQNLIDNKFAIYFPTNPQKEKASKEYMCYYYGWIRHNNNNDPKVMGPMEFGVVRNNVYQIGVNSIRHMGHPFLNTIPTDPDAPTPDEDDELLDYYIDLDFKVLDWNVKVNDDIGLGH